MVGLPGRILPICFLDTHSHHWDVTNFKDLLQPCMYDEKKSFYYSLLMWFICGRVVIYPQNQQKLIHQNSIGSTIKNCSKFSLRFNLHHNSARDF